jgi:hypothetical protein
MTVLSRDSPWELDPGCMYVRDSGNESRFCGMKGMSKQVKQVRAEDAQGSGRKDGLRSVGKCVEVGK